MARKSRKDVEELEFELEGEESDEPPVEAVYKTVHSCEQVGKKYVVYAYNLTPGGSYTKETVKTFDKLYQAHHLLNKMLSEEMIKGSAK